MNLQLTLRPAIADEGVGRLPPFRLTVTRIQRKGKLPNFMQTGEITWHLSFTG